MCVLEPIVQIYCAQKRQKTSKKDAKIKLKKRWMLGLNSRLNFTRENPFDG
jgi:hypothetical protein